MNDVIMSASTNVEIPTSLIVFVAVYLCGLWVTDFYLGFIGFTDEPFCVVAISVFWPLFWISALIVTCDEKLEEFVNRDKRDRMKRHVCGVIGLIKIALLIFRPFAFGRAVSIWRRKSKRGVMA